MIFGRLSSPSLANLWPILLSQNKRIGVENTESAAHSACLWDVELEIACTIR
jgi:hypothetical protein